MMIAALLVAGTIAGWYQAPPPPRVSCEIQRPSILSRSSAGVAQVSNLQLIQIECRRFARRPMPSSGPLRLLTVEAVVYLLGETGQRTLVPSSISASGGGADLDSESVNFYLDIPIDDADRDAAVRAFVAELNRRAASSTNELERAEAVRVLDMNPSMLGPMIRQHRTGRFRVEFRILDEGRPAGSGDFDVEVIFQGGFFDQLLRSK